jgi:hypothetical protein
MAITTMKEEICAEMERLSPVDQRRVLDLAKNLARSGLLEVPGRTLLRFAGTIDPSDLDVMQRAIEEDCERVDENGW